MIYIYDGTFEGFLSAVFDIYSHKAVPTDIVSESGGIQMSFGAECFQTETAGGKADRLLAGMDGIGGEFSGNVIFAFLSYKPGREMMIYRYIVMGFKIRDKIFSKPDDDTVRKVRDMASQTGTEKMKWKGFLRFSVLENNLFYAEMSPKNNVLSLIMPHFTRRVRTKPFLIHDLTYRQVGIFDTKEWYVCSSEGLTLPKLHSDEAKYRYMWKLFYDTVSVEGRRNIKQRGQMMPERYQRHVTELQEQTFSDEFNRSAPPPVPGEAQILLTDGFIP